MMFGMGPCIGTNLVDIGGGVNPIAKKEIRLSYHCLTHNEVRTDAH